jgi:TonB family protein
MLKRVVLSAMLAVSGPMLGQNALAQSGYKIIVNQANPATTLSKAQLSSLFLRKTVTWETGEPALPVDQVESSPLREAFSKDVLGMSPSAADQAIAAQRAERPVSVATDREVLAYVRLKPGAIGYVSSSTPVDGVRVVSFGGRSGGAVTWQDAIPVGGAVPMPAKTFNVPPVYPMAARDARQEGGVEIEVLIGANGTIEDARVVKSVALLDDAALFAVRQWKYAPTVINGKPVAVRTMVKVIFSLRG